MSSSLPQDDVDADVSFQLTPQSLLIVLSGPGGTGKTTLIKKWRAVSPDLGYVPNITTRPPRPASVIDETGFYEFVSRKQFRTLVEDKAFIQWVNPDEGKYYGTPIAPIRTAIGRGDDLVFDYTPQLYINMRRVFAQRTIGVFLVPPSLRDLRDRLDQRGTEAGRDLEVKYRMGLQDLGFVGEHDYYVVNDNLDKTLEVLQAIRLAEKHRLSRNMYILRQFDGIAPQSMMFYYDPLDARTTAMAPSAPSRPTVEK